MWECRFVGHHELGLLAEPLRALLNEAEDGCCPVQLEFDLDAAPLLAVLAQEALLLWGCTEIKANAGCTEPIELVAGFPMVAETTGRKVASQIADMNTIEAGVAKY